MRRAEKYGRKRIAGRRGIGMGVVFLLLCMVASALRVAASEAGSSVWAGRKGSLRLTYFDSVDGRDPIVHAEFTLYRVGVLVEEPKEGTLSAAFQSLIKKEDGSLLAVDASSEAAAIEGDVRRAYERAIPENGNIYAGSTGNDGVLVLEGLEPGLYLVCETRPAKKHLASAPFLFSVPFTAEVVRDGRRQGGAWQYEVAAEPKPMPCGDLVITKEVRGNAGEAAREFHFRVTLGTEGIFRFQKSDGSRGALQSGDIVALAGGQSLTIADIPVGTEYEVAENEADAGGYATESSGTKGRIRRKTIAKAVFVNSRYGDQAFPGNGFGGTSPVRTGDPTRAAAWGMVLFSSAGLILKLILGRRREKIDEEIC